VFLNPADTMLWERPTATSLSAPSRTARCSPPTGSNCTPSPRPATPRLDLPVRAGAGRGVLRRHPLPGRAGATGRSFSDFPTILGSIKDKLGKLPPDTVVYTGHGDTTRIGDEIVNYDEWVARGH
jgi:hypothetical protein